MSDIEMLWHKKEEQIFKLVPSTSTFVTLAMFTPLYKRSEGFL